MCCAVQTALRTKEIADNTLVELQGQGQRLKVINADLHEVGCCLYRRSAGKQPDRL